MDQQLQNHQTIISKITDILGEDKVEDHLNQCLYSVYAGSNDYMLNYFMSQTATTIITVGIVQQSVKPEQFTESLISRYSQQLKVCYPLIIHLIQSLATDQMPCLFFIEIVWIRSKEGGGVRTWSLRVPASAKPDRKMLTRHQRCPSAVQQQDQVTCR